MLPFKNCSNRYAQLYKSKKNKKRRKINDFLSYITASSFTEMLCNYCLNCSAPLQYTTNTLEPQVSDIAANELPVHGNQYPERENRTVLKQQFYAEKVVHY